MAPGCSMQWSSPNRKSSDARTLSPLPNEIYVEIFHCIRAHPLAELDNDPQVKRDLRNLSLVCRFFCAMTAPWLFHSICFDFDSEKPQTDPAMSHFCRKLLAGDQTAQLMAQYVTKCEFLCWKLDDENPWIAKEFLATYAEALIHMPNIEELSLTSVTITKGLVKSISTLQKLSILKFADCALADNVKQKHLEKLSSLKIKDLSFDYHTSNQRTLFSINLDTVLHLKTNRWPSLSLFSESHTPLPLESLDILVVDAQEECELEPFLLRIPSLKVLRIQSFFGVDLSMLREKINLLPQLETLEGTGYFMEYLAPGRPITSTAVSGFGKSTIQYLQKSTRSISRISLSLHAYCHNPFWKHFPELEMLEISYPLAVEPGEGPKRIIQSIVDSQPKHPRVRSLNIKMTDRAKETLDLSLQRELITTYLVPHFLTLRHCSLSKFIQWSYLESDGTWEPEVVRQKELDLLCMHGKDIDELALKPDGKCFARLVAYKKEVDPADYANLLSRQGRRRMILPKAGFLVVVDLKEITEGCEGILEAVRIPGYLDPMDVGPSDAVASGKLYNPSTDILAF